MRALAALVDARVRRALAALGSSDRAVPTTFTCREVAGWGPVAEAGAVPARRATAHPIATVAAGPE